MKEEYGDSVYFVSLTVDENDTEQGVQEFLERADATSLNTGQAAQDVRERLNGMAGLSGNSIPASILIDPDGEVVGGHIGVPTREEIAADAKKISP